MKRNTTLMLAGVALVLGLLLAMAFPAGAASVITRMQNVLIDGVLEVTGAAEYDSTLTTAGGVGVGGALSPAYTLNVTGGIGASGNTNLGGALNVDGNTTVGGTFAATGDTLAGYKFVSPNTTAITVTNGSTITPTASFQPITAAGSVGTSSIAAGSAGQFLTLINIANQTITITDTTGMVLGGNAALGQWDTLSLVYYGTTWYQVSKTDN